MSEMKKIIKILIFLLHLVRLIQPSIISDKTLYEINQQIFNQTRCSTLSCIQSSALLLQKLDLDVKPCDDFYEFACGAYIAEQHTPDEKSTVDTVRYIYQQLIEYLARIFEHPSESTTSQEIHRYAQNFFDGCMDIPKINEIGLEPLKAMFNAVGGWPLLDGWSWREENFRGWEEQINAFRKYINNNTDNIFNTKRPAKGDAEKLKAFADDTEKKVDFEKIDEQLEKLLNAIVISMGNSASNYTDDILALIAFDKKITEYQQKFKRFKKLFPKPKKVLPVIKKYHKYMLYLDTLETSVYTTAIKFKDEEITDDFSQIYVDFIKNTSNRTILNFIMWRFAQASMAYLDKDLRNFVLTIKKNAYGNEDNEQRWIYCTELITQIAPVAAGSIYIDNYFPTEDKAAADELVDYIVRVFKQNVERADWMDNKTRLATLDMATKMHRFIGYHPNMRKPEGYTFYSRLPMYTDHADFMKTGLTFKLFATDREFLGRLNPTRKPGSLDSDWTKYAQPATVNAFYSSKDNSIQFPAGILQSPNFDKDRPPFMNFGSIGTVIGHEIIHSFDNQVNQFEMWDDDSKRKYNEKTKCIVDQYSSVRVQEIEEYKIATKNDYKPVHLNGIATKNEDIADNGGLKVAYGAWKLYLQEHEEAKIRPVGLDSVDHSKIFWLSFAQTFCSIKQPEQMERQIQTDSHSLDKFRVNVPLMNLKEFADAWSCPIGSPMNPEKKCAVW